jgi:hypothetical protein
MDGNALGSTSNERRILLLALRSYSDACEPPALTPECPFFQITAKGPTCGEQCLDILAIHRDDVPHGEIWDLGDGMAAYARPTRKARRGPEQSTRPFDASVFTARDKDKPTDTKHTVSLIKELNDLLSIAPQVADDAEERSYLVKASIDELASRGFDQKDLMHVVVRQVSRAMVMWLVIAEVTANGGFGAAKLDFDVPEQWHQIGHDLVEIGPTDSDPSVSLRNLDSTVDTFMEWNSQQRLDSLISWEKLPPANFIDRRSGHTKDADFSRAKWIVDRFTSTYLYNWSTSSLDLEWKYIHGQEVGCSNPEQMGLRRVRREDVAVVLAERAVKRRGSTEGRRLRVRGASDFTEAGIGLLSAGRYDSAAAMYEALHRLDPTDPELANNLGFCLMPTDPERALSLFVESTSLSSHPQSVAWANQVATLYVLRRDTEAYALTEQSHPHSNPFCAWLWTIDDSRRIVKLSHVSNVTEYVDGLKARIAAAEGKPAE